TLPLASSCASCTTLPRLPRPPSLFRHPRYIPCYISLRLVRLVVILCSSWNLSLLLPSKGDCLRQLRRILGRLEFLSLESLVASLLSSSIHTRADFLAPFAPAVRRSSFRPRYGRAC